MSTLPTTAGVFSIVCLFSNRSYVGFSANIAKGVDTIFSQLEHDRHRNGDFQCLYYDYGRNGFIVRIIRETADECEAKQLTNALINSGQYQLNKRKGDGDIALIEEVVTPWGRFSDAQAAAKGAPFSYFEARWFIEGCFHPQTELTESAALLLINLFEIPKEKVAGTTWADQGFGTKQYYRRIDQQ